MDNQAEEIMSEYTAEPSSESLRRHMTLEEQAEAAPITATQGMPTDLQEVLRTDSGVYVRSESKPAMDFATEPVPRVPGMWRVLGSPRDEELLTAIPGGEQTEVEAEGAPSVSVEIDGTEGYRPPWVDLDFMPRLVPFISEGRRDRVFLEPRAQEAQRLTYPWQTNGRVISNRGPGSGVLVGPNLMLTASHVAPWGISPWSMEFVPAFRAGDPNPRPFGSSFVSQFRGIRIDLDDTRPTGYDYVICRLFNPLGQALGWMGSVAFGDEDEYYSRRYNSTGYPDTFQGRMAVEFNMAVADIDSGDPGLELEFELGGLGLGKGWSGGPLWLPSEGPNVAGTVAGQEQDVVDPTRHVISAGFHMVDLVKFGLANWPP